MNKVIFNNCDHHEYTSRPCVEDYSPAQLDAAGRDMQAALDVWPALTPSGFHVAARPIAIPRSVEWLGPINAAISEDSETFGFWQSRMDMRTDEALAAFMACRAWLRANAVKRKSLNKQFRSEKLWRIAAQNLGEVSHGVFIAALDLEGFTVKQSIDCLGQPTANAWTNVALKAEFWKRTLRGRR
jgi:hypothetical protein